LWKEGVFEFGVSESRSVCTTIGENDGESKDVGLIPNRHCALRHRIAFGLASTAGFVGEVGLVLRLPPAHDTLVTSFPVVLALDVDQCRVVNSNTIFAHLQSSMAAHATRLRAQLLNSREIRHQVPSE
jgi:hypothetical protein